MRAKYGQLDQLFNTANAIAMRKVHTQQTKAISTWMGIFFVLASVSSTSALRGPEGAEPVARSNRLGKRTLRDGNTNNADNRRV